MTTHRVVNEAVQKGAAFIASVQKPDGGFDSFSSPVRSPFRAAITYQTVFAPALILGALAPLDNLVSQTVRAKLAKWLLAQKSPNWSYNYWAKNAPERTRLPYPDDLDDTFCALIALHAHDPTLITADGLASIVKLLVATESQLGGPYRTWLIAKDAPKAWQDVDLAVNANIAAFLSSVAEPLPNLTSLMEKAIVARTFNSPYYPSPYPVIYYLSRAYSGERTADLAQFLLQQQEGDSWGNALHSALAISALTRLGQSSRCDTAITRLLKEQNDDGSWRAEALCLDPAVEKQTHFSGSAALTTALALEAISRYRQATVASTPTPKTRKTGDKLAQTLHSRITKVVAEEIKHLSPELRRQTGSLLKKTVDGDKNHEIMLLPYSFSLSLAKSVPPKANDLFLNLGLANLYGWTAYTIYDDFLDNEGKPEELSAANTALRYSLKHFERALPNNKAFATLVGQTFDVIDGANAWELARCRASTTDKTITIGRLPKYPNTLHLSDRSLGHTLTPMAILAASGIPPDDKRAILVRQALRHYIVARQLNDDMHDWEQDLRAGIVTYVVTDILRGLSVGPGTYTLARLLPKMQRQFWHHTLTNVCGIISNHTALAQRAAKSSGLLVHPNIVTMLTSNIDKSVRHTLDEQAKAKLFLASYSGNHK